MSRDITEFSAEEVTAIFQEATKNSINESFEKGLPVVYEDDKGKIIREYPDGKIEVIDIDPEEFEDDGEL